MVQRDRSAEPASGEKGPEKAAGKGDTKVAALFRGKVRGMVAAARLEKTAKSKKPADRPEG